MYTSDSQLGYFTESCAPKPVVWPAEQSVLRDQLVRVAMCVTQHNDSCTHLNHPQTNVPTDHSVHTHLSPDLRVALFPHIGAEDSWPTGDDHWD